MGANITIDGHIGKAPEARSTATGMEVADFSVAVNHYKGRDKESTTSWYRVSVWGKPVDSVRDWQKGDYVIVSGELELREWTDRDGAKRISADLNARSFSNISKMMRARKGGDAGPGDGGGWHEGPPAGGAAPRSSAPAPRPSAGPAGGAPPTEDDLPF